MARLTAVTTLALAALVATFMLLQLIASPAAAQVDSCGGATVVIEGGDPAPFLIPQMRGDTLRIREDTLLLVNVEDRLSPPDRRRVRLGIVGLGYSFDAITRDVSPAPGSAAAEVDVGEVLPSYARGLFEIDLTLIDDDIEVCTVRFRVRVGDFGGIVGTAAAAAAGFVGMGALASIPLASSGMNAKLKLKVQLQRRRPRGWRRFVPVPAWKRTIISTVIGAITGLALAVVLQQAGTTPLSVTTAVWGMVAGGGITFGVGYSLGMVRTFLRPPEIPEDEAR